MAKKFAPRVSKRSRKTIDMGEKFSRDFFKLSDQKLLEGARLEEVKLSEVFVKEQVRTKFNDKSLKELADNIRENGLIQPLVVHRVAGKLTLICGERRYRAMGLIKKKTAPCFILENKSSEELMAIQFSENSSREELHYIDKADGILSYQKATKASERQIVKALGISKTEVHRSLQLAKVPKEIKEAAKRYNIEKYVLLEWQALGSSAVKKKLKSQILKGELVKRAQLKKTPIGAQKLRKTKAIKPRTSNDLATKALLKAVQKQSKSLKIDTKTKKLLGKIMQQAQEEVAE